MAYLCIPRRLNSFYSLDLKHNVSPELYFVFGSNLAGRHGRGAAKEALMKYGATYGIGEGFAGMSYAIPTKDKEIRTLPLKQIEKYVERFIVITKTTNKFFYVTPIGTGLAGYKHSEIAPLFKGCLNCWLPLEWREFVLNKDEINERIQNGEIYDYK